MNYRSKFEEDTEVAYSSIRDAVDGLKKDIPIEAIVFVLCGLTGWQFYQLTEIDQWELIKGAFIDMCDNYDEFVPAQLSNLIDYNLEAEKYDKRYGQRG